MAWKAGAELTMMEFSYPLTWAQFLHTWYAGAAMQAMRTCLVDANNKKLPIPTGLERWRYTRSMAQGRDILRDGVLKEYELPFYGDFPAGN